MTYNVFSGTLNPTQSTREDGPRTRVSEMTPVFTARVVCTEPRMMMIPP